MKTLVILTTAIMLGTGYGEPSSVEHDPAKYSGDWAKLTGQIRAILPGGWVLEVTPFNDGSVANEQLRGDGNDPMIVIYRPTPVHAIPKNAVSFLVRQEPFLVRYRLEPKMSQQKWEEVRAGNDRSERLINWYQSQLAGCAKGNDKYSGPSHYDPKTDEERRLLREFYFVSGIARSATLPDHWFGSLAVFSHTNTGYTFREKDVEEEYSKVVSKVFKLMNAYGSPNKQNR